jgi:hypothetical protein
VVEQVVEEVVEGRVGYGHSGRRVDVEEHTWMKASMAMNSLPNIDAIGISVRDMPRYAECAK